MGVGKRHQDWPGTVNYIGHLSIAQQHDAARRIDAYDIYKGVENKLEQELKNILTLVDTDDR